MKKKRSPPRAVRVVLLVEDHQDVRDMYADYLQFSGFHVIAAANGAEGVDAARSERPDLILMDATMPGIDGWEATRLLKADDETRHIPILMLTAHVFGEHQARAREVGADGFIAKPCLPDELVREVTAALEQWHRPHARVEDQAGEAKVRPSKVRTSVRKRN